MLDFIKYYIRFDDKAFFDKFDEGIQLITKSREAMGIREAILQEFKEIGIREGREQGLEEGLEEGLQQGLQQGYVKGINEKELAVIFRAWKKGMPVEEIADLVDVPVEKVKAVIEELMEDEKGNTPT